jgi:HK97 family phage major capsid protein/HK97 family phage prohead protease
MNQRAWSTLTIKSVDDDLRIIEGIASTPSTDRMGDIVEPKGAQFNLPMPLLWQHKSSEPIGHVIAANVTAAGITIKAQIAKGVLPKIDEAWALIKSGLVRGLSIGFQPLEFSQIKDTGGLRFTKWDWHELSAVTIPANADASISAIKSIDEASRAASGHVAKQVVHLSPGVAGQTSKGKAMATYQEQVASFEAKRAATVAAIDTLLAKSAEEGRTFTEAEQQEHDDFDGEIKKIDSHLTVLRSALERSKTSAVPVVENKTETAPKIRSTDAVIRNNSNLPKGIGLARYAKALCWARINMASPLDYAKQWDDSTPEVSLALKTAIGSGTTTDSTWASPLVYNSNLASEFVDYLRPQTIMGRMDGWRRVPFNVRYPVQNGGSTVGWVGQGAPKPVSKLSFTSGSLGMAKCAGIVVVTQELARFSSPAAELVVRDDMAAQMQYFQDQQFIDPSIAAVSNVSPASVLNGASNVRQAAAAWTSMANVLTDVKAFLTTFATNEIALNGAYWVMTPDTALSIGLLLNTGGTAFAFPEIDVNGGTFLGLPVITSNSVPHSTSAGAIIALIKPNEVFLADDGGVNITVSGEASINMDSAPTNNSATPTATSVVSMFQTDSLAIRAERFLNYALRRSYGVGYLDNVHVS